MATATSAAPSAASSLDGMADDRDDAPALAQRAHLGAAIGGEHGGPHVLDVERAPDRLARVAGLAAQEHRLDARVEQPLHRRARAGAQPVLQRDEADEAIAERDEEHAAALPFELGHPAVDRGDADLLREHDCAAPHDEALARRRERGHAQARVHCGVAHVVGPGGPGARGAQDGRGEGVRRPGLGAGRERQDARDLFVAGLRAAGADGLDGDDSRALRAAPSRARSAPRCSPTRRARTRAGPCT